MKAIINLRLPINEVSKSSASVTDLNDAIKKSNPKQQVGTIDSISSCKISDLEILLTVGVTLEAKTKK